MIVTGVRVGDDADAWRAAGFEVTGGAVDLEGFRVECTGDDQPPAFLVLADDDPPADVDGIRSVASEPPSSVPAHPNHVSGIDHVVVATPDLDRTQSALEALGVPCRRVRDAGTSERPMQQRFFRTGPVILEVVGTPGRAADGPAAVWGLALLAADLDATVAWLGDACGQPKDAVQPGRRIATVRTRDLGISLPVALMTP